MRQKRPSGASTQRTRANDSPCQGSIEMSGNQSHEGLVVVRGAADGFVQEVIAGVH